MWPSGFRVTGSYSGYILCGCPFISSLVVNLWKFGHRQIWRSGNPRLLFSAVISLFPVFLSSTPEIVGPQICPPSPVRCDVASRAEDKGCSGPIEASYLVRDCQWSQWVLCKWCSVHQACPWRAVRGSLGGWWRQAVADPWSFAEG